MKNIIFIISLAILTTAMTCRQKLKVNNGFSDNLELTLMVDDGNCYTPIGTRTSKKINSNITFRSQNDSDISYLHLGALIKENRIIIVNKKERSYWPVSYSNFEKNNTYKLTHTNKKTLPKDFIECSRLERD